MLTFSVVLMIFVIGIKVILSHEMMLLVGFMMIVNDHNRTL